jgi:hypothetical protein
MDRMSRVLWWIGVAGTLVVAAAAATGWALRGVREADASRHVLVSLAATLIVLFAHVWAFLYLWGTGRAVAAAVAAGELDAGSEGSVRRLRRRTQPWIAAATLATAALFVFGGQVATGAMPPGLHAALAGLALLTQGMALWGERRALGATDRLLRGPEGEARSASAAAGA